MAEIVRCAYGSAVQVGCLVAVSVAEFGRPFRPQTVIERRGVPGALVGIDLIEVLPVGPGRDYGHRSRQRGCEGPNVAGGNKIIAAVELIYRPVIGRALGERCRVVSSSGLQLRDLRQITGIGPEIDIMADGIDAGAPA